MDFEADDYLEPHRQNLLHDEIRSPESKISLPPYLSSFLLMNIDERVGFRSCKSASPSRYCIYPNDRQPAKPIRKKFFAGQAPNEKPFFAEGLFIWNKFIFLTCAKQKTLLNNQEFQQHKHILSLDLAIHKLKISLMIIIYQTRQNLSTVCRK